jgi:hypothetical protein
MTFTKIIHPLTQRGPNGRPTIPVFCKIEYDGKRLSIIGVEGPMLNGDAKGSCGQILHVIRGGARGHKLTPGWSEGMLKDFLAVWRDWHLNDMRAGCEHQRASGWDKKPNASIGKPCPVCGYEYGSSWLSVDVPDEVLDFLANLPDTDREPAWV